VNFVAENSKKNSKIGFGRKNQLSPQFAYTWGNGTGYTSINLFLKEILVFTLYTFLHTEANGISIFLHKKICSLNFYFLFLKISTYNQNTTYIISVKAGKVLPGIA
jgi:hypothetical protein